jgi:alpha-D-ribose 1-methylphosphonate 5-triphosphate synthase subunit PhnH
MARKRGALPWGVDLFLVSGTRFCALPRTTHIEP